MEPKWRLKAWGVRGSLPAASRDRMAYGGNTSCFSVDCGEDLVVFDAGSGLTAMGGSLRSGQVLHIFISHVHFDHIMGLFIFPPFYDPSAEIHIYGEPRSGVSFRQQLETIIGPPYWPVGFADFQARVTIHETGPDRQISLPGGRRVRVMRGSHPNLGLMYRLEDGERSVVYTLDCELNDALRPRLTDFCRDAGVLIWDANYTAQDLARHPGWGHSSWEQGADLGKAAGAKLVLLAHLNRDYDDAYMGELEQLAQRPGVQFAREGMEVWI